MGARWSAAVLGLALLPATASAANHVVTAQSNFTFSPRDLTINAGDTVTFQNGGGVHNVASDPGSVTSFRCANGCDGAGGNGNLSGAAWSATVTFPTAGTIGYFCEAHGAPGGSGMAGTITVNAIAALSISNASVVEGNSGTKLATFTISLSQASGSAVMFNVATSNGTATAGSDYVARSLAGQSIPAGMTSQAFNVTINGDIVLEPNETFNVTVSNVAGATLADGAGVGTIVNDDVAPPADVNPDLSGDFNGDGKSDLLWRNFSTGANVYWKSAHSATAQGVTGVTDLAWIVAGVGDVNADNRSDIVWRNTVTGANVLWYSANSAIAQNLSSVSNLQWKIVAVDDFTGDNRADLLWRNFSTGANVIWKSANAAAAQGVTGLANLAWIVAGVGDINADNKSDIVWRNTSSGANVVWYSANSAIAQGLTGVTNQQWKIVGVADFTGDGRSDLLWRNFSTGANVIWRTANAATPQSVTALGTAWIVAAIGDYNGDAKADIIWRNTSTGANAVWYSANFATGQSLTAVTLQWRIVP